jgi:hypothetical protein
MRKLPLWVPKMGVNYRFVFHNYAYISFIFSMLWKKSSTEMRTLPHPHTHRGYCRLRFSFTCTGDAPGWEPERNAIVIVRIVDTTPVKP